MINKDQLTDLYSRGTYPFSAAELAHLPLSDAIKTFLVTNGLPESRGTGDFDNVLGIHFVTDVQQITPITIEGATYWKIADEWEENQLIIAVKEGTEEVYDIDLEEQRVQFVNSDLFAFLLLLNYFKQYSLRKDKFSAPPPKPMSRAEAMKQIELMKQAKLPPAPEPKERFDYKKEARAMKAFMKETDAVALKKDDYWWSTILEQVEDDII